MRKNTTLTQNIGLILLGLVGLVLPLIPGVVLIGIGIYNIIEK